MIVYEVNLEVNADIYEEYVPWLVSHINKIIGFNGFKKAKLLDETDLDSNTDPAKSTRNLTIHYELDTRENLQEYFDQHAPGMRKEGNERYGGKFKASRRIFKLKNDFVK